MTTSKDVSETDTTISSGTYRQCMVSVSPTPGRNIAVMAISLENKTMSTEQTKLEMSVAVSHDAIEALANEYDEYYNKERDESRSPIPMSPPEQFRSITPTMWESNSPPPRRIGSPCPNPDPVPCHHKRTSSQRSKSQNRKPMSSPPPKHTPPIPTDESFSSHRSTTPLPFSRSPSPHQHSHTSSPASDSPIPRSTTPLPFSSPPVRRVSTPLYIIGSPPPDRRSVSPIPPKLSTGRVRPVMMRMATVCVTSPVMARRSISPLPTVTYSTDDTKCNYGSLYGPAGKENLVENDILDTVRLQKMFRKLQRQIHSPEHQGNYPWPPVNCLETWKQERELSSRQANHLNRAGQGGERLMPGRPTNRRSFAEQGRSPVSVSTNRRSTLGSIGRSVTICNSGHPPVDLQARRESFRRTTSDAKLDLDPAMDHECSIEFEIEDLSSPVLERPTTLPELNSRPASRMMERLSPIEGDLERQKRKRATAIVTSGALTFMVLAAALVTASFLMSPVIEDVFVHRKMNQSGEYENGTTYGGIYPMDVLSVHQRSQLPVSSNTRQKSKKSWKAIPLKSRQFDFKLH